MAGRTIKHSAARTAVLRERKFAEPVAPKRLPDAPPPKPDPMSAPLPCCRSTSPMIASATSTWHTIKTVVSILQSPLCACGGAQDRQEIRRDERRAADQAAVDVRHRENRGSVLRLDAAAVQDRRRVPQLRRHPLAQERVHLLRLLGRCVACGADRPYRLICHHAAGERHCAQLPPP